MIGAIGAVGALTVAGFAVGFVVVLIVLFSPWR